MQEASDRLEFETAALLRDQINAITKLTAGQKVVVDPDVEMDVVALAGTPDSVCAAVLRFREGRLTDKREFLFHDTSDIDAVREEFLPRYYLDDEQIPKIIAVDALPPDMLATIKSKVQSGAYGSTSEVIREAMRFWEKQQEEHEARLALIRNRLSASTQSGEPVPLDDAFKAIERMHRRRMKSGANEKV